MLATDSEDTCTCITINVAIVALRILRECMQLNAHGTTFQDRRSVWAVARGLLEEECSGTKAAPASNREHEQGAERGEQSQ